MSTDQYMFTAGTEHYRAAARAALAAISAVRSGAAVHAPKRERGEGPRAPAPVELPESY